MAEEPSDAEKMRLKRLARLGNLPPRTNDAAQASPDAPGAPATPPLRTEPVASGSRPISAAPVAKKAVPLSPVGGRSAEPPSVGRAELSRVGTRSLPKNEVPYGEWEAEKVGTIFGVTLSKEAAVASNWNLCWLKGLHQEMVDEGLDPQIDLEVIDRLLIARLSLDHSAMSASDDPDILLILAGLPEQETTFEYLVGCWTRLYGANREIRKTGYSDDDRQHWISAFEKVKRLIISYTGMTLEDPSMFPQPADKAAGPAEFLPLLLALHDQPSGDPLSGPVRNNAASILPSSDIPLFLNDLATEFDSDTLADVITPTLSLFFQEWFKITPTPNLMGEEWRRYLGAVATLTQLKPFAQIVPMLPIWVAEGVDATRLEWQSLLGPLIRLSVYPREFGEIWKAYFSNPTERTVADINANKSNLRLTLQALQQSLFGIFNAILRSSPDAREAIVKYFLQVVRLNRKRAGMRVDPRTVSTDGFMTNLQMILLKLFEPVMDVRYSKIDKVDAGYYRSGRIDIGDETKLNATAEEVQTYFAEPTATPHFISDLFFLLNAFQHLGLVKTLGTRERAEKSVAEIEKELKHQETARSTWQTPAAQNEGEAAVSKLKADLAVLHASLHAYDTQLLDPALLRLNITFLGFSMTWMTRLADPTHAHPNVAIQLPLPTTAPAALRMLPEYMVENISEYFDFLARYEPDALEDADKDILITFTLTMLTPGYVNNPFLRAKLVTILSHGLWPMGRWRRGALFDRLGMHPLSTQHLMPTLIQFFIDIETTGGHSQFWDKFNFRRDVNRIFKSMWSNPLHREAFVKASHNQDQFIKFINMLMNDTTFHLEESLTGLAKIHQLQEEMSNGSWSSRSQEEQADITSQLRQNEGSAPFHTQLGLDNVELILDLTATTRQPFITPEIVDRLAATLDENLKTLVGPKMQDLKLAAPEKYSFKPKKLLAAIAQVYINLGEEQDFIRAVANDGRSYSKEVFDRFARILKNRAIMTDAEVQSMLAFNQRVEVMKETIAVEDEREVPDEFLDPILATLMKDPVILPVSRMTIDRSTIRTHLLSTDKDPFNNVPLKLDECLPDEELKAKINAWLAEGQARTLPDDESRMDVDG